MPSVNNCFNIIAQVLLNSVINSVNKENIAHILLQLCWLHASTWASSFERFIFLIPKTYKKYQKIPRTFIPFVLKSVLLTFQHLSCSSQFNFLLLHLSLPRKHLTECKVAILKFSALAIITLCTVIIARYDAILAQLHVHLYNHLSEQLHL